MKGKDDPSRFRKGFRSMTAAGASPLAPLLLLLAGGLWSALLLGGAHMPALDPRGPRFHGMAPSPFGSPEAWRLTTWSMASLMGAPPVLPCLPLPVAELDHPCPSADLATPVRLDPAFVARLAAESPAVNETELYDLLVLTWRVCKEEGYHFLRTVAQMRAESDFNPRLRSRSGAIGLMQILPDTAREMGFDDVWDPERNIRCAVRYMKYLDQFVRRQRSPRERWIATLACYNSGPGTYSNLSARALRRGKSLRWQDVARYYRRRFPRIPGTDAPETIIYIRRNLRTLHRLHGGLFIPPGQA